MKKLLLVSLGTVLFMCGDKGIEQNELDSSSQALLGQWIYSDVNTEATYNWYFKRDTLQRNSERIVGGYPDISAKILYFWKLESDTLKMWRPQHCIQVLGGGMICDPVDTLKMHAQVTGSELRLSNSDSTRVLQRVEP